MESVNRMLEYATSLKPRTGNKVRERKTGDGMMEDQSHGGCTVPDQLTLKETGRTLIAIPHP
jgi:hypothetical protein